MRRLLIAMTILLSACNLVADPTADEICPSRAVDFDAAEEISLDGLKGLQWTPRGIPVGTILYFPGGGFNSVSRFDIPSQVVRLVDVGWVVRSVEYTTGDPDQAFDDAWHWATQRHAAPTQPAGRSHRTSGWMASTSRRGLPSRLRWIPTLLATTGGSGSTGQRRSRTSILRTLEPTISRLPATWCMGITT